MLPEAVLKKAAEEMLDYEGCGQSVMEMSHRSKVFDKIIKDAEKLVRELMNVPDNYKVLFLQGGGSSQFTMVAQNLMNKNNKADYIITGQWAKKAWKEASRYGDAKAVASSEDKVFSYIPKTTRADFRDDADYVYICMNNTIYGTVYHELPDTGDIPLVADIQRYGYHSEYVQLQDSCRCRLSVQHTSLLYDLHRKARYGVDQERHRRP